MRIYAVGLAVVLALLQYRLWISNDGVRSVRRLTQSVAAQRVENQHLRERNLQLAAEVKDLKEGLSALEERARNDLGMIGANETFFQVVDGPAAAPAVPRAAGQHVGR
jgi:cell division protein FtsB